jgi:hypothetical protein
MLGEAGSKDHPLTLTIWKIHGSYENFVFDVSKNLLRFQIGEGKEEGIKCLKGSRQADLCLDFLQDIYTFLKTEKQTTDHEGKHTFQGGFHITDFH